MSADSITSRALELCSEIQDGLDLWIELGACFDKLACEWIATQQGKPVSRRDTLRKREKSKVQGLRKRAIAHLETLVSSTGRWKANQQSFAISRAGAFGGLDRAAQE